VPGEVDILVAGTSCVDYSNLNNEKQEMEANGESGRTFRGMLAWVTKHRPPIVILENVCSAPWLKIVKRFEMEGYSAISTRVDTKHYYIPHTRTRGYLMAIDIERSGAPQRWKDRIVELARPASASLDAFLLPTDDPRIQGAREKLVQESKAALEKRREKIDWARCEVRHARARADEELGGKRPLTSWTEGGGCKPTDHMWTDWATVLVERVWDLLDITVLRKAKRGLDASYKTFVVMHSRVVYNIDIFPAKCGIFHKMSTVKPILELESLLVLPLP
jgi:site-specific DNA-cytosine methylase